MHQHDQYNSLHPHSHSYFWFNFVSMGDINNNLIISAEINISDFLVP